MTASHLQAVVATIYYLTETINATSCSNTDTVAIKVNPLPQPDAGKPQTVCIGSPVYLGYAGTTGDTYQWSSLPTGFSSTLASTKDYPSVSNLYIFIIKETDTSTGCSNSDSVNIEVAGPPILSVIAGLRQVCTNDSPQQYQVGYNNGSKYTWKISHGLIVSGQGTSVVYVQFDSAGVSLLTVSETNSAGCTSVRDSQADIIVAQSPNAHFKVLSYSPVYAFKAIDTVEQGYAWAFGDGAKGDLYKTTHQYPYEKDSFVNVSLTVSSVVGCSSVFDTAMDILYFPPNMFNIQVFPNPFENNATIRAELSQPARISISVYDAIGRHIEKIADAQQSPGTQDYKINPIAQQWAPGIYFLQISVNGDMFVRPIIKE